VKQVAKLASLAVVLAVLGCKDETARTNAAAPVRPVLSLVVRSAGNHAVGFAGTIQPRYQTDRGFRVLGRIIARNVDVGDVVKAGQTLAQLDPLIYDLAMRSSQAELAKARSQLSNAAATQVRRSALLGKQIVSQAEFDSAQQAREAALASEQQALANFEKAREQRSYTTLSADIDGVVTSTDAELGQTVSPGKKVITLARLDIREAVVDLPEEVTQSLTIGAPFEIRLQADLSITTTGKVREVAPQADAATRTRRVKITLDRVEDVFRLGTTITVMPMRTAAAAELEIPRAAVLTRDGTTRVWIVDPVSKTVRTIPVEVADQNDEVARIAGGLSVGSRIVIAGVNSLSEGQSVKMSENESAPQ
jgi:RND family efflux transporter MFP subunit